MTMMIQRFWLLVEGKRRKPAQSKMMGMVMMMMMTRRMIKGKNIQASDSCLDSCCKNAKKIKN